MEGRLNEVRSLSAVDSVKCSGSAAAVRRASSQVPPSEALGAPRVDRPAAREA